MQFTRVCHDTFIGRLTGRLYRDNVFIVTNRYIRAENIVTPRSKAPIINTSQICDEISSGVRNFLQEFPTGVYDAWQPQQRYMALRQLI